MGKPGPKLASVLTTTTLLLLVLLGYWRSQIEERQKIRIATMAQAREHAARFNGLLENRLLAIKVLAEAWTAQDTNPLPADALLRLLPSFRRHYRSFQAVNWIDTAGVVQLVFPPGSNLALNQNVSRHPSAAVRDTYARSIRLHRVLSTPILEILQDGRVGFSVYVPLLDATGARAGCLNGLFQLDTVMTKVIDSSGARDFNVELYDGNRTVYRYQPDSTSLVRHSHLDAQIPIQFLNQSWRLRLIPSEALVADLYSRIPRRMSVVGGILAFLAGLTAYLFGRRTQERRRLVEQLQISEERYRRVVDNAPIAIFTLDRSGRLQSMNLPGARLFGAKEETDLNASLLSDLAGPRETERISRAVEQTLTGEPVAFDFRAETETHGSRRFRVTLLPIINPDGKISQVVGVAEDVTERSRAEETLRALAAGAGGEDIFSFLAEGLAKVLGTRWALVGRLTEDKNLVEVLGFWDSGRRRSRFTYPVAGTPCESVLSSLETRHFPEKVAEQFPDDQMLVEMGVDAYLGAPLKDHEGRAIGIISVFHDQPIPHHPMTRQILDVFNRRASSELERFIAGERLRRNEEQLLQSRKMEAVGRLAGGIAHDFNNILTGITGYCNLIVMGLAEDHPIRRDVEEILRAAERAAGLTHQLLAFSRRQVIEPRILNLNEVLMEMDPMLRRLIGEDIDLHTICAADLGNVRADRGQIQQVIINLAVNARDAMPTGGKLTIETANVTLEREYIRTHVEVAPGNYVLLAVSDTGSGIPADVIGHIFEPFFTTKEQHGGSGLGLATVYGIVKQSGGHVWVYSEEGQGTTFKIYLPRIDEPAEIKARSASATVPGMGERILLVEDDQAVREPVVRILRQIGYDVLVAETPAKAMELVVGEGRAVDLLVTDVVMPGMNGRELAERLRERFPDLQVIFISGYTENVIVHHGVLEDGLAFLQKPFDPGALARKIRQLLEQSRE